MLPCSLKPLGGVHTCSFSFICSRIYLVSCYLATLRHMTSNFCESFVVELRISVVIFVVGGKLSVEKEQLLLSALHINILQQKAQTLKSSWLEETQVEFELLRLADFPIRHGGQELRAFITTNALLRKRESSLPLQELTLNENTQSAMLFEMTKSGKIVVRMKAK